MLNYLAGVRDLTLHALHLGVGVAELSPSLRVQVDHLIADIVLLVNYELLPLLLRVPVASDNHGIV